MEIGLQSRGKNMIKALLVEDEAITRKGLLKHMPWIQLGIDEIRSGEDAETAMKISEEYKPDIIISDIKMRGIDGIDMCRFLKEQLPDCQIIFISSYSQKEYLKAAIELEAIQYVEKPIDLKELSDAVCKAVERHKKICEQQNMQVNYETSVSHMKNETFFTLLRKRNNRNCETILNMAGLWNERCNGFRICIIKWADLSAEPECFKEWYLRTTDLCKEKKGLYVHADFWDNTSLIIYLATEGTQLEDRGPILTSMRMLANRQDKEHLHFLAIGKFCSNPSELVCSYQSALRAAQCLAFKGYGTSACYLEDYEEWQGEWEAEEEKALRVAIQKKDLQMVIQAVNGMFDQLIKRRVALNSFVRNSCLMIYNDIHVEEKSKLRIGHKSTMPRKEYIYIIEQATTLEEIREVLLRYIRRTFDNNHMECRCGNPIIKQVITYMHGHYHERGLNINRLAEEVFLTPTYLSSLFKQDTGLTINQYLTKIRVEYAKVFLMEPNLKLYHVADKVGYEDAAYFARIFKNLTGMTPSEYKEKKLL